jgi:uncharacterized protein YndB with AHSA1/START domain
MRNSVKAKFEYTTYIAARPEKVWDALVTPAVTQKYWQHRNVSDWQPGSRWEHRRCDAAGTLDITGKVVEIARPRLLELTWAEPGGENNPKKVSRVRLAVEPFRGVTRVRVDHDGLEPGSEMLAGISEGWPMVLASLKSLLESGRALPVLWEQPAEKAAAPGCRP